ncbi:DUF3368 domain-containing protein [Halomarina pelagica]|uniref:DUF3368 domain-containing protein n=1 Tax=Halomarina pelagica TaxID=2961599 RepID=UPI0020C301A2|nr:DUF3368 domain-containing protein [Halomarina sp. BND7]
MDETYGRDVAATEGITTRGTAYPVLSIATRGRSAPPTRAALDAMVEADWYCALDVYARVVRKLDSIAD